MYWILYQLYRNCVFSYQGRHTFSQILLRNIHRGELPASKLPTLMLKTVLGG